MNAFQYPDDRATALLYAVWRKDILAIQRFWTQERYCQLPGFEKPYPLRLMVEAGGESTPDVIRVLVELGADINETDAMGTTGLGWAVTKDRPDLVKTLLECGADPNIHCPIFNTATQNIKEPIGMAKLLLDHGADINEPFIVEGLPPRTVLSEAIARGKTELVAFLKSRGAQLPGGLPPAGQQRASNKRRSDADASDGFDRELLLHFAKHYGRPKPRVIREIVPTSDFPVDIRYIPPTPQQNKGVLFTTGLSHFQMPVPHGAEAYRRAELMVMLPGDWPEPDIAMKQPQFAWPIQWLRKIAAYPVVHSTWLGAPCTVISNEDPPKPLGRGTRFTAWLLTALDEPKSVVKPKRGVAIQIYSMFPLYTEEYLLERTEGYPALMERFVKKGFSDFIDLNRANVAL